ncbi:MAG: hypothetical protein OYH77_02290 [Pseudomonadota bacterium]|nr:hypothetical protein [Pseudomonadota bacterium]
MNKQYLVLIACIFTMCSSNNQHNVPGEDTSVALLLGQGLNTVDGSIKGFCVELGELKTQSSQSAGQYTEFRMLEITSESSLRENLNISAAGVLKSSVFFKLDSRFRFARSVNKNKMSRYLLVHARVANQIELASNFNFKQSATDLLKSGHTEEFIGFCGNEFAYGRRTGGELFALFEFEFSTREQERKFDLAIKSSGMGSLGWQAAADLDNNTNYFANFSRSQVKIFSLGGMGKLPRVNSITEFGEEFEKFIAALKKRSVTLEIITKDYSGVEPIDLTVKPRFLLRQDQIVQQLARNRDQAVEMLNTVTYVKRNLQNYEEVSVDYLDQKELEIKAFINANNQHVIACFEDVFKGCHVPELVMPTLRMPQKKSSKQSGQHDCGDNCCKTTKTVVCQLQDKHTCLLHSLQVESACPEKQTSD